MTDGVLVNIAATGHLAHSAAGHLVHKDGVPSSCPGIPPLVSSYDLSWTGGVGGSCNIWNGESPLQLDTYTTCGWRLTTGNKFENLALVSSPDQWRVTMAYGIGIGYVVYIVAYKTLGSTPVGSYTVAVRNNGFCGGGANTIDDIAVVES